MKGTSSAILRPSGMTVVMSLDAYNYVILALNFYVNEHLAYHDVDETSRKEC